MNLAQPDRRSLRPLGALDNIHPDRLAFRKLHHAGPLQRLSHGLARHIVGHWPDIASPDRDEAERTARGALLSMLMTVNPGVQVYLLDADGRVPPVMLLVFPRRD